MKKILLALSLLTLTSLNIKPELKNAPWPIGATADIVEGAARTATFQLGDRYYDENGDYTDSVWPVGGLSQTARGSGRLVTFQLGDDYYN